MPVITLRRALVSEHSLLLSIDDRASVLFEQAGLSLEHLTASHAFAVSEYARWRIALTRSAVWLASIDGEVAGFLVMGTIDGEAYLDQLSVLPGFMRRGVGRTLIARAFVLSETSGTLWLTTYAHLPWNRAYYERFGFVSVARSRCGPELTAVLDAQCAALPAPEQRIAMRKDCARRAL